MTKSQNTKKEHHCIKQNEKSFIQKDLSLTELWQKGELPCGWYYIKIADIVFIDFFEGKVWKNKKDEYIEEVLAEVPTFEEWKASEKYNKHLEEVIKVYEQKDKQATETSIAYNELVKENEQLKEEVSRESYKVSEAYCFVDELKELLKECKKMLMQSNYQNMTQYHEVLDMRDKIDEVLGEK